jgi:methylenetetrahydrofolate/methylenetetrahydromethanopterin dehydrogenase (NADP+)
LTKPKILIQLDTDHHASVFDGVVAVDAGIDHLFQYSDVKPETVRALIHGAMFTRGPQELHNTAVFVGGSDVDLGRQVAEAARVACFDPFRISIAHDSNGSNSTAAAAVLSASKHLDFSKSKSIVLAGTGAVGKTVANLIVGLGGEVIVSSRKKQRSIETCLQLVKQGSAEAKLIPLGTDEAGALEEALSNVHAIFGCGAAGIELLTSPQLALATRAVVAVDLNAVPPAGISKIQVTDNATDRNGRLDYGALGVGGLKMKIHKASIRELFQSNSHFIDATRMMEIGRQILKAQSQSF